MKTPMPPTFGRLRPLLLLPALACSALGLDPGRAKERDLHRAEGLWARQHLANYRFTYGSSCGMCVPIGPAVVEVHADVITSARTVGESDPLPMTQTTSIPTVPDLFALIGRAIDQEADALEVTYHPTLGYPVTVAIDWRFGLADDEVWHSMDELRRIPPASTD